MESVLIVNEQILITAVVADYTNDLADVILLVGDSKQNKKPDLKKIHSLFAFNKTKFITFVAGYNYKTG